MASEILKSPSTFSIEKHASLNSSHVCGFGGAGYFIILFYLFLALMKKYAHFFMIFIRTRWEFSVELTMVQ